MQLNVSIFSFFPTLSQGMSTIPEVVVGRHSDMRVFGLSLITDVCNLESASKNKVTHDEVLKVANERAILLQKVFIKFIGMME